MIAYDNASNSGYQATQSGFSWFHACAGANGLLTVDVHIFGFNIGVESVTAKGVPMTVISASNSTSGSQRVECWVLAGATTGTIEVLTGTADAVIGAAVSYAGVDPLTPIESVIAGNGGNLPIQVTVAPLSENTWAHAALTTELASPITATHTDRNSVTGALGTGADQDSDAGTPVVIGYDAEAGGLWAMVGYAIRPFVPPPPPLP